jgi:hypothetical protein
MIVRRDHVAGAAPILAGLILLAVSRDLPFGTLASPGAGMLPTIVIALMIAFGLVLLAGAAASPPLAELGWSDVGHAARVVAVAAAAIALYTTLGFLLTVSLVLFALIFIVERQPLLPAASFSIVVTLAAYLLFNTLLRAPMPRGLLWF